MAQAWESSSVKSRSETATRSPRRLPNCEGSAHISAALVISTATYSTHMMCATARYRAATVTERSSSCASNTLQYLQKNVLSFGCTQRSWVYTSCCPGAPTALDRLKEVACVDYLSSY